MKIHQNNEVARAHTYIGNIHMLVHLSSKHWPSATIHRLNLVITSFIIQCGVRAPTLVSLGQKVWHILHFFTIKRTDKFGICSRHDIAELLLKLALNTNQSIKFGYYSYYFSKVMTTIHSSSKITSYGPVHFRRNLRDAVSLTHCSILLIKPPKKCTHSYIMSGSLFEYRWVIFSDNLWQVSNNKQDLLFSLLRQTSSYFYSARQKKYHVRFTGKCMLYSLCQLPPNSPCFSFLK